MDSCRLGIEGDGDLYGLGIRLALYCQWTCTLLATLFAPEEESINCLINLLLQVALLVGLVIKTATRKATTIEPMIILWLLFGALSSLTGDGINPLERLSGVCRLLIYAATSAYFVWFWYGDGWRRLRPTPCRPFFFYKANTLGGWFGILGKTVSMAGLVASAALLAAAAYRFWKKPELVRKVHRPQARLQTEIPFLLLSLAIILFSVMTTEILVHGNRIEGVDEIGSVGQLIPFLVGLFGLLASLASIKARHLLRQKRCWTIFGRHLT
ncbi:hypothetical protein OQA88_4646 [Cercophora sp. LCS_1]